jgi:hypothetical protein
MKRRPICPNCGFNEFRTSRIRFYDWPLYLLGVIALRCVSCDHRFYRHRLATPMTQRTIANS